MKKTVFILLLILFSNMLYAQTDSYLILKPNYNDLNQFLRITKNKYLSFEEAKDFYNKLKNEDDFQIKGVRFKKRDDENIKVNGEIRKFSKGSIKILNSTINFVLKVKKITTKKGITNINGFTVKFYYRNASKNDEVLGRIAKVKELTLIELPKKILVFPSQAHILIFAKHLREIFLKEQTPKKLTMTKYAYPETKNSAYLLFVEPVTQQGSSGLRFTEETNNNKSNFFVPDVKKFVRIITTTE